MARTCTLRPPVPPSALEFDEILNAKVDRIYDEISKRAAALRPDLFQDLKLKGPHQQF